MSADHPGHSPSAPLGPSSRPVASISRTALLRNFDRAHGAGLRGCALSALEADAWGHGAALVTSVLGTSAFAADGEIDPLILYGLPGAGADAEPVMRLSGTVLLVKPLRAGEGVSYGYTHRALADTRIALVAGGYAQGIVRALGNRIRVSAAGRLLPVIGRVAMDACVVDIDDAPVARGDEVVFFGDPARGEPSLTQWCAATGLTPGELVTTAGLRASRAEVG